MSREWLRRRDFLRRLAAGSAVIGMPAFLQGCAVLPAADVTTPPPGNPFLAWFGIDEAAMARVMSELTSRGADTAELYFQHRRNHAIGLDDGIVSRADSSIEQGVGLRVVVGGQTGYAFTEDLTLTSMLAAAKTAAAIASGEAIVSPQHFATSGSGNLYRTEVAWSDVGIERKLPHLQRVDRYARAADPAVENVSVHWADIDERVLIATLDGRMITDRRPMTRLSAQVMARRDDEVQSGFANIAARAGIDWYTQARIERMTREAVDRTLVLFDARQPPAGDMPVVLAAGTSGVLLHETIGHGLEADFNRSGISPYVDSLGQSVAEPIVTVVDQATIANERGALNVDDEGTACGRNVLIERGVLRSYLHDALSAAQYGVAPTGSARRESYRFAPMPRMTCTWMESGAHSHDEIIASVKRGIVADTYTTGQVELGAGDFRFHVRNGWLVENGKLTAPIRDFTVSGNGPQMLRRVTMVADDAVLDTGGWTCGKQGQQVPVSEGMPTVLVSAMSVGGEHGG